jgi:uncharacterized membrane protein YtjA (UPF0391 family)
MLRWALIFLCVLILVAVWGFAGILGAAPGIASPLFWLFSGFFAISLEVGRPASA